MSTITCPSCTSTSVRFILHTLDKYVCANCDFYFSFLLSNEDDKNKEKNKNLTAYPSGATRSSDADEFRFDLLPPQPVERRAKIMAEGAKTHGDHLALYKKGDKSEDHLAKVTVNADFIMYFESLLSNNKKENS